MRFQKNIGESASTWQDMFEAKNPLCQNKTVSLELSGNTATIKWRPRFIVYECGKAWRKVRLLPSSTLFEVYARLAVNAAFRWNSKSFPNPDPVVIRGIEGSFDVEVYDKAGKLYKHGDSLSCYDFSADSYASSNFAVFLGGRDSAIVWDAFRWRPRKTLRVKIGVRERNSPVSPQHFSRIAEHEFGHVLGLFDAYGYAKRPDPEDGSRHYGGHPWPDKLLPPAFIDKTRLLRNSVMVCDYLASHGCEASERVFARTSLDYEMVLLAFYEKKLQLYSNSILGKRSQAFNED